MQEDENSASDRSIFDFTKKVRAISSTWSITNYNYIIYLNMYLCIYRKIR